MTIRLEITTAPGSSIALAHPGPRCRLGRDPLCEVALTGKIAEVVSGEHARIDLAGSEARLIDLGSTNGTYLNGRRVVGRVVLRAGDEIQLGQTGPLLRVWEVQPAPGGSGADWPKDHEPGPADGRQSTTALVFAAMQRNSSKLLLAVGVAVLLLVRRLIEGHLTSDPTLVEGALAAVCLVAGWIFLRWRGRRSPGRQAQGGLARCQGSRGAQVHQQRQPVG